MRGGVVQFFARSWTTSSARSARSEPSVAQMIVVASISSSPLVDRSHGCALALEHQLEPGPAHRRCLTARARPAPRAVSGRLRCSEAKRFSSARKSATGRLRLESRRSGFSWSRVVAVERPVAGVDGLLLVQHPVLDLDAVLDAVAVGDHERGARIVPPPPRAPSRPARCRRRGRSGRRRRRRSPSRSCRGPSCGSACRPTANFATAPRGVAFEAWPPVFE